MEAAELRDSGSQCGTDSQLGAETETDTEYCQICGRTV